MRRFALLLIVLSLLAGLCACSGGETAPTDAGGDESTGAAEPATGNDPIPEALIGTWSSAGSGQLDMTETFTFNEDGTLSATAVLRGTQSPTVSGTFTVDGHTLYCEVTGGVSEPYTVTFEFRIDGRELYLTDNDGESQFLRVS